MRELKSLGRIGTREGRLAETTPKPERFHEHSADSAAYQIDTDRTRAEMIKRRLMAVKVDFNADSKELAAALAGLPAGGPYSAMIGGPKNRPPRRETVPAGLRQRILELRREGYSQERTAERLNISRSVVRRAEQNQPSDSKAASTGPAARW